MLSACSIRALGVDHAGRYLAARGRPITQGKAGYGAELPVRRNGEPITVDKGWLTELVERFAEAAAAVARGNARAAGVEAELACVTAVFDTGALPTGCG